MTELEQYKKAYATLVGRVDAALSSLESNPKGMPAAFLASTLAMALQEAEEIFLAGDPEDE